MTLPDPHLATLPPPGLPGLDPSWSRLVAVTGADGLTRTFHVLDRPADGPALGTLLCVHGNPTWSYLWRRVLAQAPPGWRVVAPDQLGMGWSEGVSAPRTYAERVRDLGELTDALGVTGPVVTVAHDWGGAISLGWALAHRASLAGVVLTNTAVSQPPDSTAPAVIRLARSPLLREATCARTPTFVRATTALSRPPLPADVRAAYAAPYATAERRRAVADFVADIPLEPGHVSFPPLAAVAAGLGALADVPVLMLWGPRDPVFSDRYLRDLMTRLPHADVHRFAGASHLVTEDAPKAVDALVTWLGDLTAPAGDDVRLPLPGSAPLGAELERRARDTSPAVVELSGAGRTVSWAQLATRVRELAAGFAATGVRPGDRVALLIPPGADLTAAVYACWRARAVIVVADAGLGVSGLGRALRGAGPDHVVAIGRGLAAARVMRVPGRFILAGSDLVTARALGAHDTLDGIARRGRAELASDDARHEPPSPLDECAILFTSGATGPAKGVLYRHGQLQAQLAAVRDTYRITADDRLVAAFAPFALYGPALGIASAVPDMDVTAPGTLTASALADAAEAVHASLVFASPAALRNVVATADELDLDQHAALGAVRLVMSAGAPVPVSLLRSVARLLPKASAHTPYGMTEVLPVTDVSLTELANASASAPGGVCVGRPVSGVSLALSPLDDAAHAEGDLTTEPGVTGEICVRAAHVKDRYDRLWVTERASSRTAGWHRTGDVGHLDPDGRLWVQGRLAHVVTTADGVVTPVGPEQRVEALETVRAAAVTGVGPAGTQQVVVVVVPTAAPRRRAGALAAPELAEAVRAVAGVPVAAVLVTAALPVDIRHASKVDRARLGRWATAVLSGARAGRP